MTDTSNHMSPEASPGLVPKTGGGRRVNNLPLLLLGGVLTIFLVMMMLVAADRAAKQNAPAEIKKERAGNTAAFAREIAGDQKDGIIAPAHPLNPPAEPGGLPNAPIMIAKPGNLDEPPLPPGAGMRPPPAQPMHDDEATRIRMAKLQMLEEAVKARTGVQVVAPRSNGSSPGGMSGSPTTRGDMAAQISAVRQQIEQSQRDDPTAAYQARLEKIRAMGIGGNPDQGAGASAPQLLQNKTANPTNRTNVAQFQGGTTDRWRLDSQPEPPRSPYELRAGFVIPATLISGINSSLPGQIMAQVAQHVYDTPTGRHLLIPQGSRLVGSYSNDIVYGQSRVLVAWQRIVFPDGKAMDIGAMPGADSAGYAGFNDQVNNHYFRLFASAFLMSGVTAGITLSQDTGSSNTGDRRRASDALSEALGQQLGQVTAQLIAKNMNVAPTLEIRPGYRFNVIVTKDMTFSKPYQSFDY